ncbi:MAG: hypothetical protein IJ418_16370 [Clostridia bacterium]|nr:hypothetical protein [Clostridia bacterium]
MKSKYVVLQESSYDITNGHSTYKKVKTFKNEPEAIAFVSDPKNIRMYGGLFLECHSADGVCYEWNADRQEWQLP